VIDHARRRLLAGAGACSVLAALPLAASEDLAPRKRGSASVSVREYGARGNGRTDDTDAFQAAIDSLPAAGGTIRVSGGRYMIDPLRSIRLGDHMHLELDQDAQLIAIPNDAERAYVISVLGKRDVEISGGRIVGERDKHLGTTGEWGHGIMVRGAQGVTLRSLHISRCWGDGISIGGISGKGGADSIPSRDVVVAHVTCDGNRRQGLTVGRSRQVRVIRSSFINTGGTKPAAGIDVEPDAGDIARGISIAHCLMADNEGPGLQLYHRSSDVTVRRCTIRGNRGDGIYVTGAEDSVIADNTISGNRLRGLSVRGRSRGLLVSGNRFVGNSTRRKPAADAARSRERHLHVADTAQAIDIAADNTFG
jgi:parallel beta-helix repeat protein